MSIAINNIVSFSRARTNLSELVIEVENGAEKIITKNGEPAVALISTKQLAHYHRLEADNIALSLLREAQIGWADVQAGRTGDAKTMLTALKNKRHHQNNAS